MYIIESKTRRTRQDQTQVVIIVARMIDPPEGIIDAVVRKNVAPGANLDQYEEGAEVANNVVAGAS